MTINIRAIQHYMYCPRRFGLLEINDDWEENVFVVKANIMHENVHSGKHMYKGSGKIERSSVALYNDELDIYGIADCVEFVRTPDGEEIRQLDGRFLVRVIEYKPSQPKNGSIRETDAIQVFAQKLCADYIWNCNSEGWIYYADTKKRVKLPFDLEYEYYYSLLTKLLGQMRSCLCGGEIPPRKVGQQCGGCSLKDMCMHQVKKYNVRNLAAGGGDVCESF